MHFVLRLSDGSTDISHYAATFVISLLPYLQGHIQQGGGWLPGSSFPTPRNRNYKTQQIQLYVDLLYYNQLSLLHVSTTYCDHLQGGVL
jgi:hypothetical protein